MSFRSALRYALATAAVFCLAVAIIEIVAVFYPGSGRTPSMSDPIGDAAIAAALAWAWGLLSEKNDDRSES